MRLARRMFRTCRIAIGPDGRHLPPDHRHKVAWTTMVGPRRWYTVECTDQPTRYRPTR